jgi:hypothetical protein
MEVSTVGDLDLRVIDIAVEGEGMASEENRL